MGATGDELGKKIESEIGLVSGMNLYLFSFHVETNKLCFQVDLKIAHVALDLNKLFETTRESFVSLNPQPTMSFAQLLFSKSTQSSYNTHQSKFFHSFIIYNFFFQAGTVTNPTI